MILKSSNEGVGRILGLISGGIVTVEAESLAMQDVSVISDNNGSAAKAVKIDNITSQLTGQVNLPKGKYLVTLYVTELLLFQFWLNTQYRLFEIRPLV